MGLEFGLQLFSVRDELQKDFIGTLEKLALIGYKNIELFFHGDDLKATIGNLEPAILKQELDRLELKAVSAHIAEEHLEVNNGEEIIGYSKLLGVQSLVIAIAYFKNKEEVLAFSKRLNEFGKLLKTHNLQLYYHNHFHEFQEFDGEYVLDTILKNTNEDLVKVEFDTYWCLRGGIDPLEYLKKLGGRCDLIHQKDLSAEVDTINLFNKVGNDSVLNRESMVNVRNTDDFTEMGQGIMDIPGIIETFRNNPEAKYIFVEQDWTKRSQIESVEISYRYLSKFFSE